MRHFILLLILSCTFITQGQEIVSSYSIDKIHRNALPLHYIDNDSLLHSLFLERKELFLFNHDENLQITDHENYEIPKRGHDNVIGHVFTKDNQVQVFYANNRYNKFEILDIDPMSRNSVIQEVDLKLKKQTFLHGFSYNNHFYFLTIDFNANFVLFEFDGASYTVSSFPASQLKYKESKTARSFFVNEALKSGSQSQTGNATVEILEENLPNSIEQVSTPSKIVKRGDKLFIIVDLDYQRTDIYEISLADKSMRVNSYDQPFSDFDNDSSVKSNSYLHEDKVYQVMVSKEQLVWSVKDYDSKKELKKFTVQRDDDDIPFANTPITQLGGAYDNYRELEKTKQLLRKMSNSVPGISVHRIDGQLEVTIGASKEVMNAGLMIVSGIAAGAAGTVGNGNNFYVDMTYNPFFTSYYSDVNSKSVYVIGLFNDDINHMIGEISNNAWDKIESYVEDKEPYQEDIFEYRGKIYYSYYNREADQYILIRI
ncbi:MAG: hypothetical protein WBG46_14035 [Nonlabens sp.]